MDPTGTGTAWVIFDPPGSGIWNMAVDEALLDAVANGGNVVLRFYQWQEATLSLGYFQHASDRQAHRASGHCPLVRRPSGGGAIVHDDELTYTLVLPACHRLAAHSTAFYRAVHGTLATALGRQGISTQLHHALEKPAAHERPFLCFQRRAAGDLLLGKTKIAGSAQRRRKGATLQHGSVLLERSPAAPELAGIAELTGTRPDCGRLARDWTKLLARELAVQFQPAKHARATITHADKLAHEKYGSAHWTMRRNAGIRSS